MIFKELANSTTLIGIAEGAIYGLADAIDGLTKGFKNVENYS